jgi:hypothetical protein
MRNWIQLILLVLINKNIKLELNVIRRIFSWVSVRCEYVYEKIQ